MGSWWSSPQYEVDELRQAVIKLFNGQQLLFVGTVGSGKSSLVNSINYVLNLKRSESVVYQEVARISAGEADHGTLTYRTYSSENKLFHELKEMNLLQDPSRAPKLVDIAGINEQVLNDGFDLKQLLIYLVTGKVREFTQMVQLFNSAGELEKISKQEKVQANRTWLMICVISLEEPFPKKFFHQVAEALKKLCSEGAPNVFVILTKADKLPKLDLQGRVEDYTRQCTTILNIMQKRIFVVTNYLPEELKDNTTMVKRIEKERQVLVALNRILQPSYKPDWKDE